MRFVNHQVVAREFLRRATTEPIPDAIVCSLPTIEFASAAAHYARRFSVPLILDIRDLWPDIVVHLLWRPLRRPARLALWWMYQAFGRAVRDATSVCGISQSAIDWACETAGRARTEVDCVFPHAYMNEAPDATAIAAAERRWDERGVTAHRDVLRACFIGNLSPRIELSTVVDAARCLEARGVPVQVVIAGSGEMLGPLQLRAQGLNNVVFSGWVGAAELWTLLRRAHVGLLPYPLAPDLVRWPTNKVSEYLSAALPIVSSAQGEVANLLATNGCGVTYPNGDTDFLVTTLTDLATDEARLAEMSSNAKTLYHNCFRGEVVYGKFAELIETLGRRPQRVAIGSTGSRCEGGC